MKKLLLGLGAVTAVAAPIAAVVACSGDDTNKKTVGVGAHHAHINFATTKDFVVTATNGGLHY